ncbi:hypothetical protein V8E54_007215 [Elaphomyces granulatus]
MDDVVHIADETVRKAATSTRLQATRIRECRVFTLPDERNIVKYAGPWKSFYLSIVPHRSSRYQHTSEAISFPSLPTQRPRFSQSQRPEASLSPAPSSEGDQYRHVQESQNSQSQQKHIQTWKQLFCYWARVVENNHLGWQLFRININICGICGGPGANAGAVST